MRFDLLNAYQWVTTQTFERWGTSTLFMLVKHIEAPFMQEFLALHDFQIALDHVLHQI
jgi:hypothetical protein